MNRRRGKNPHQALNNRELRAAGTLFPHDSDWPVRAEISD
jgi:hypothetical protein